MSITNLGLLPPLPIEEAMLANTTLLSSLPKSEVKYGVKIDGGEEIPASAFEDDGSRWASAANPSRLQEMGRFMQRVDLPVVKYGNITTI